MKKKYYLMFEMLNCINYSSRCFDSVDDAKKVLERIRKDKNPLIMRLAVGYWEEIPFDGSGNLKIFHFCCETHRIDK